MSIHPIMTNNEINFIVNEIKEVAENHFFWAKEYTYNKKQNSFTYKLAEYSNKIIERVDSWFETRFS